MSDRLEVDRPVDPQDPRGFDRRDAEARARQWMLEIDRALFASKHGGAGGDVAETPSLAGPRSSRAGTTRYSAPAHLFAPLTARPAAAAAEPERAAAGTGPLREAEVERDHEHEREFDQPVQAGGAAMPQRDALGSEAAPLRSAAGSSGMGAPAAGPVDAGAGSIGRVGSTGGQPGQGGRADSPAHMGAPASEQWALANGKSERSRAPGVQHPGAPAGRAFHDAGSSTAAVDGGVNRASNGPATEPVNRMGNGAANGSSALAVAGTASLRATTGNARPGAPAMGLDCVPAAPAEDQAAEAPEAARRDPARSSGRQYGARNVHVHVDDEGVHAWLRDASLDPADAAAVARALAVQGALAEQALASVTINGNLLQRAGQRTRAPTAGREGLGADLDEPDTPIEFHSTDKETNRHDHQRR